jgi:PTH1 family peptidyl-tRNA hydrolase
MISGNEIRLVVGLGNPGESHQNDRHNVGFWLLDGWANKNNAPLHSSARYSGISGKCPNGVSFLKPTTYMNLSGQSVASYANYFGIEAKKILVAHDDLDLSAGCVRLKYGGGHGGHNGLRSITQSLGSDSYYRIRIGIGRPEQGRDVSAFVLGKPSSEERLIICSRIDDVLALSDKIISGSFESAMNVLNRRDSN